jgi:hypothetical protein
MFNNVNYRGLKKKKGLFPGPYHLDTPNLKTHTHTPNAVHSAWAVVKPAAPTNVTEATRSTNAYQLSQLYRVGCNT